jgi:hypothetical protein
MGSFHQTHELVRWNHRDCLLASAADNHDLTIVRYAVEYGGEALSEIGISGFRQVSIPSCIVQGSCTVGQLL